MREQRADVWLGVDANQGFTREGLEQLLPVLIEARVELIEQPFPAGNEQALDGIDCPIPIAADESVQDRADLQGIVGRVQVINVKLDKCGGLTEALALAHEARDRGLRLMVGNMVGTSLAMAPAFIVGQLCDIVDLDGPLLLARDRMPGAQYRGWPHLVRPGDLGNVMLLPQPYLLFLGDVTEAPMAKTAFGLRDWAPQFCVGEYALPGTKITTGLPSLTPAQAYARGARSLVIGVASPGGALAPSWIAALVEAMEAGLDLVSGMHTRLED